MNTDNRGGDVAVMNPYHQQRLLCGISIGLCLQLWRTFTTGLIRRCHPGGRRASRYDRSTPLARRPIR
jgi:hypothetical protein